MTGVTRDSSFNGGGLLRLRERGRDEVERDGLCEPAKGIVLAPVWPFKESILVGTCFISGVVP